MYVFLSFFWCDAADYPLRAFHTTNTIRSNNHQGPSKENYGRTERGWEGYSFVARHSSLTIDHVSLSRRSTGRGEGGGGVLMSCMAVVVWPYHWERGGGSPRNEVRSKPAIAPAFQRTICVPHILERAYQHNGRQTVSTCMWTLTPIDWQPRFRYKSLGTFNTWYVIKRGSQSSASAKHQLDDRGYATGAGTYRK